jgi:O-antigen/teichoic acid export membrane protein
MSEHDAPPAGNPLSGRFLFNINFVFVCTLVSNTVGFFAIILLARSLGPDGRGVVALYQAAVALGYAFLNLGIASAVFYYVTRREVTARQAMETGATISLFSAAVTALGVAVTALFLEHHLEGRDVPYALAILAVPAVIQLRVADGLLRAAGRFGAMNALEVGSPVVLLICLGATELTVGLTVESAVWVLSLAVLVPLAAAYILLGLDAWPRRFAPVSSIRKTLAFGGQIQATTLIQLFNYRLDVFLILVFVNTAGVGLYTVAASQTEGLLIIANSVAIVLLTNITAGDDANAAHLTPVVCRNTLLVTGVAALVAAAIAPLWLTAVFGADYAGSVLPYLCLLPGTVALSGAKILAAYVFSRGRPIINAWIALATLLATIPTDIVLIYALGVSGAAIGTSLGYVLSLALTAVAYRRLSGRPLLEALVPQRSDLAIYTGALRSGLSRLRRQRVQAQTEP